jgi:hypothetical protein
MINFVLNYDGWQTYATDKLTVEIVCSLVNLGILKLNNFGQMKLKSREHANRFMEV